MSRVLPILEWGRSYRPAMLTSDLIAAVIVTIMLIPQSLAYAMLAGLPPQVGLYASIAPLLIYALLGTSRTLAVGPVAVTSLMTAAALGKIAAEGSADYVAGAIVLALLSGAMLLVMGVARVGFLANFLSHPVISGFITSSGILIATSQLKHVFGVDASGETLPTLVRSLAANLGGMNMATLAIGALAVAFLAWARGGLAPLLDRLGLGSVAALRLARAGPAMAVAASILAVWALGLGASGVAIVGDVPSGLPPLVIPGFDPALWGELALPALAIAVVGYVETISVAQTLAAKRRQRVSPNQELIALGGANLGAAVSGGYPVTGGFSRSVVNFDAGAETPAAGAFTAVFIALATLFLTGALYYLPKAVLAATILVAVLALLDIQALARVWRYSKSDFAAMATTIAVTLGFGVEPGIAAGVVISLALHLYRTSQPHAAVVGQVPGTEHFRNVLRHDVVVAPNVLTVRVDESLYFANARYLEDLVMGEVVARTEIAHVVLMCPAVNAIDASALESLEAINHRLADAGVTFHLSEVKGPVMDRLHRSDFLDELTGKVFLSQIDAMRALAPDCADAAGKGRRATPAT